MNFMQLHFAAASSSRQQQQQQQQTMDRNMKVPVT